MLRQVLKIILIMLLVFHFTGVIEAQDWEKLTRKDHPTFSEVQDAAQKYFRRVKETSGRVPGLKQFKRWEWFAGTRLDKDGYFDPSLNWKGWLEKEERFGPAGSAGGSWTPLGPDVMPGLSGLGRINCVEFDPLNPDIIWVGAPTGGLWKSADGGLTWSTTTDYLPNIGVSDIVIHSRNPDIMYIATGDKQRGSTLSLGVMKSLDGGLTWNFTGLNPEVTEKYKIGKLIMHPAAPDSLLAATNKGIFKTVNGGDSWVNRHPGDFFDLEVHPVNSSVWFASRSADGIYRSTDSGDHWTRLSSGLPDPGPDIGRIAITLCISSPNVMYAVYCQDVVGEGWVWGLYGFYRSLDGGDSWQLQASYPNLLGWEINGSDSGGQGGYALVLDVNPDSPNEVYVGSVNLWKSTDAGLSWQVIARSVHVDHHDLAFAPNSSSTLFSCNDGGIYKSTDRGVNWTDLTSGLGIHQVYRVGVSQQDPNRLIIGAQDNGSSYYDGSWRAVYGGDGTDCLVDPNNPSNFYCSWQWGHLLRSRNEGRVLIDIFFTAGAAWIAPFLVSPTDSATLYIASNMVFMSNDRGDSWNAISGYLFTEPARVMAAAPSASGCLYVSDGGKIFKTTNTGSNWTELNTAGFPSYITGMLVHPDNPNILWVTFGGYGRWNSRFTWFNIPYQIDKPKVFYSENGGVSWTDVSGLLPNIPVNCIAIDPYYAGVYVGTDLGVFYSQSGLGDWQRFDNGLPNVIVTDLEIQKPAGQIIAATYGRGVWQSPLVSASDFKGVYPPLNFSGRSEINRSLLQSETIHILNWEANPYNNGNVAFYNVHRVSFDSKSLLVRLDAGTFEFRERGVGSGIYKYALTAVDRQGYESVPLYLTLRVE